MTDTAGSAPKKSFSLKPNDVSIAAKLAVGFGVVVAILVAIAMTGILSFGNTLRSLTTFEEMSENSTILTSLQTDVLMTRLGVKDFVINDDQASQAMVEERLANVNASMEAAQNVVQSPERAQLVASIDSNKQAYEQAFETVTDLQARRHAYVNDQIAPLGRSMRSDLSEVMASAYQDQDITAAYYAGVAQQHLMLARLYAERFLLNNDAAAAARSLDEITNTENALQSLLSELQNITRRQLTIGVRESLGIYEVAFENVVETIQQRNQLITNELDRAGPIMATQLTELQTSIQSDMLATGKETHGLVEFARQKAIVFMIAGVLLAALAAWLIARMTAKPIGRMTEVMETLAAGNYTVAIPGLDRGDEIGDMAKTVAVFKENGLRIQEMQAEEEANKANMEAEKQAALEAMAGSFEQSIGAVIQSLGAQADEMKASAQSMSAIAEETSRQVVSASSATEQANSNVQTVAAASEELSSSIAEVNRQV
ncbi:MAG: HAMP domain-containing protein, partial [Pseudomonadota bacterium]